MPKNLNKSSNYLNTIKHTWENKGYKNRKSLALCCTVIRNNCFDLFLMIFYSLLIVGLEFISVMLFRLYIKSFSVNLKERPQYETYQIAIVFFSLKLLVELFKRLANQFQSIVAFKSGFEVNCLIYEKVLKAAAASRNEKVSEGEIVNLMQVDSTKLNSSIQMSPALFTAPIQIIAYTYMLFVYFGISASFGLAIMLLFLVINYFMYRMYQLFFRSNLKNKDKRMGITNETISNLKLLKLYAWEQTYLKRILDARKIEMSLIAKVFCLSIFNVGSSFLSPMLVSFATFVGYQEYAEEMKIEDIMTGLYVFAIISASIRSLPLSLNSVIETLVSMSRIERFIKQDEIEYDNLVRFYDSKNNNEENSNESDVGSKKVMRFRDELNKKALLDDYPEYNDSTFLPKIDEETLEKKKLEMNDIAISINNLSFSWGVETEEKRKREKAEKEKNNQDNKNNKNKKDNKDEDVKEIRDSTILTNNDINNNNTETTIMNNNLDYPVEKHIPTTLKNITLNIKKGEFLGIIGEVGSGKSSLLQAILNNMIILNHTSEQFRSDERIYIAGSVSYVPQVPWIENCTLKENILFNHSYNEEYYKKVLKLCELEPDIEALIGGDLTEIGEKGINLSGGQKARVSLARAIYTNADITILDDPISALDAHVGHEIMTNLIMKELKGKTRVLVTHALQYLNNCDRIIYMKNGRLDWQGDYQELITQDFYTELYQKLEKKNSEVVVNKEEEDIEEDIEDQILNDENLMKKFSLEEDNLAKNNENEDAENNEITDSRDNLRNSRDFEPLNKKLSHKTNKTHKSSISKDKKDNKKDDTKRITVEEDREEGSVAGIIYHKFIQYEGGYFLFFLVLLVMGIWQAMKAISDIWILHWKNDKDPENKWLNLYIYGALGIGSSVFVFIRVWILTSCNMRMSSRVHNEMVTSLVNAPINLYHDTVPKGRILNRLSKDIGLLDTMMMFVSGGIIWTIYTFLGIIVVCSIYSIYSLAFLPVLFIPGYIISNFSNNANRDLTRLESITRSPIGNLLAETIPGAMTIRAYHLEHVYMKKFFNRIDMNYQINMFKAGVLNWFSLLMGMTSLLFLLFLLVWTTVFKKNYNQDSISILITYSLNLQQTLFDLLTYLRLFETTMISMERCLAFTDIPSENPLYLETDKNLIEDKDTYNNESKDTDENNRIKLWPKRGDIEFRNYSVKYRPDTEIVLKNLSFKIKSGQRVGVVGRTGSGKSTLCLSIFRLLEPTEGTIFIDDVDICNVGLTTLRSGLTIIPQDPSLMKGTLRYNIDPLEQFSDEKILDVVKKVGMLYVVENNENGLNQEVSESGTNLSVGEKQLICISRALLRVS